MSLARRLAAAVLVIAGTIGGVALWQSGGTPVDSSTPADSSASADPLAFGHPPSGRAKRFEPRVGVRAFLDQGAGVLHLGGQTIPLTRVPGLAESGIAVRVGVVYQTPDQEVRLVRASGRQTVLADALGPPPQGFTPSLAYAMDSDVVVALRLTAGSSAQGRPLIAAYAASTGRRLAGSQMIQMADATAVTLAGATNGMAAVNYQSAHWDGALSWTWTVRDKGGEWNKVPVFDLRDRVVLGGGGARPYDWGPDFRFQGRWRYVQGHEGEQLDPTGAWRLSSTWQPWPSGGPVERSTSGDDSRPLPDLPSGTRLSLAYDTDGSVLAAVAGAAGSKDLVRMFDCDQQAQECEPIGRVKGATQDPLFLVGTA